MSIMRTRDLAKEEIRTLFGGAFTSKVELLKSYSKQADDFGLANAPSIGELDDDFDDSPMDEEEFFHLHDDKLLIDGI